MGNMLSVWEILVNCIEAFLFYYLLKNHLKYNASKKGFLLVGLLLRIAWISFLNFNLKSTTVSLILLLFYDLLFTVLTFNGSISEKILWGSSYVIIALTADKTAFWFAGRFTPFPLEELLVSGKIRLLMSLLYLLLCTIMVILLSHWKQKDLFLPNRFRLILLLLVVSGILASDQLLNLIIYSGKKADDYLLHRLELISFIVLFILFGFIFFIEYLGIVLGQKEELQLKNSFYEAEKKRYESVSATISALKDWKHDYKNQLIYLSALLQQNKYTEAVQCISRLETGLAQTPSLVSTGNEMLDSILSVKIMDMQKYHIPFDYHVYLNSEFSADSLLFISFLGNLLDNAVEACQNISEEKRYIQLQIKPYHEMLHIKIINSSENHYLYNSDGTLKSTKKKDGHGIGLKRIHEIAEQLGGFCHVTPENGKFTVAAMLPIKGEKIQ